MYIVFGFDFHFRAWIFYIVARGINFTEKKILSYLFPFFAITHIFHGRFASVHSGSLILSDILYAIPVL